MITITKSGKIIAFIIPVITVPPYNRPLNYPKPRRNKKKIKIL